MEIARTNTDEGVEVTSRRRSYPAEFKAEILRQVDAGSPVARVALQHRINPVTVHRWRREAIQQGNPPEKPPLREVENSQGEFLHEEVPIQRQSDH